jgi:hypothetical protein
MPSSSRPPADNGEDNEQNELQVDTVVRIETEPGLKIVNLSSPKYDWIGSGTGGNLRRHEAGEAVGDKQADKIQDHRYRYEQKGP